MERGSGASVTRTVGDEVDSWPLSVEDEGRVFVVLNSAEYSDFSGNNTRGRGGGNWATIGTMFSVEVFDFLAFVTPQMFL